MRAFQKDLQSDIVPSHFIGETDILTARFCLNTSTNRNGKIYSNAQVHGRCMCRITFDVHGVAPVHVRVVVLRGLALPLRLSLVLALVLLLGCNGLGSGLCACCVVDREGGAVTRGAVIGVLLVAGLTRGRIGSHCQRRHQARDQDEDDVFQGSISLDLRFRGSSPDVVGFPNLEFRCWGPSGFEKGRARACALALRFGQPLAPKAAAI